MHGGVSKYYKDLSSFKLVVRFMPVIFSKKYIASTSLVAIPHLLYTDK
jgi:hypothetical protein